MAKEEMIKMEGLVTETLPNNMYRVSVKGNDDQDMSILAYASGRLNMNHIKILPGDKVSVELSPYDLSKGRITRRN